MRLEIVDGLKTLFYDGSEIYNREHDEEIFRIKRHERDEDTEGWSWDSDYEFFFVLSLSDECSAYYQERQSWEQVIVLDGVTVIPASTFFGCCNIRKVIFADTVIEIKECAFHSCENLAYIKLSINLERIGERAFQNCDLFSVFIPLRCREIKDAAFLNNQRLQIFNVPQGTKLNRQQIIAETKLIKESSFKTFQHEYTCLFYYYHDQIDDIHHWIKNINNEEAFALHRVCSSFRPLLEVIYAIIERKGLRAFNEKNSIGVTPSMYLKENPYTEITEVEVIRDYILTKLDEKK